MSHRLSLRMNFKKTRESQIRQFNKKNNFDALDYKL